MQHHHFLWLNQLFLWQCSIANCYITRGYSCFLWFFFPVVPPKHFWVDDPTQMLVTRDGTHRTLNFGPCWALLSYLMITQKKHVCGFRPHSRSFFEAALFGLKNSVIGGSVSMEIGAPFLIFIHV